MASTIQLVSLFTIFLGKKNRFSSRFVFEIRCCYFSSVVFTQNFIEGAPIEKNFDETKRNLQMEGILIGKRQFPTDGILLGRRNYPMEGIMLGRREFPTDGIMIGKRNYPIEGIMLGKRNYPTEGVLLGRRNSLDLPVEK